MKTISIAALTFRRFFNHLVETQQPAVGDSWYSLVIQIPPKKVAVVLVCFAPGFRAIWMPF